MFTRSNLKNIFSNIRLLLLLSVCMLLVSTIDAMEPDGVLAHHAQELVTVSIEKALSLKRLKEIMAEKNLDEATQHAILAAFESDVTIQRQLQDNESEGTNPHERRAFLETFVEQWFADYRVPDAEYKSHAACAERDAKFRAYLHANRVAVSIPQDDAPLHAAVAARRSLIRSCLLPYLHSDIIPIVQDYEPQVFRVVRHHRYKLQNVPEGLPLPAEAPTTLSNSMQNVRVSDEGIVELAACINNVFYPCKYIIYPETDQSHTVPLSQEVSHFVGGHGLFDTHIVIDRNGRKKLVSLITDEVIDLPQDVNRILAVSPSGKNYVSISQDLRKPRIHVDGLQVSVQNEDCYAHDNRHSISDHQNPLILMTRPWDGGDFPQEMHVFNHVGQLLFTMPCETDPLAIDQAGRVITRFNSAMGALEDVSLAGKTIGTRQILNPSEIYSAYPRNNIQPAGCCLVQTNNNQIKCIHTRSDAPITLDSRTTMTDTHDLAASPSGKWIVYRTHHRLGVGYYGHGYQNMDYLHVIQIESVKDAHIFPATISSLSYASILDSLSCENSSSSSSSSMSSSSIASKRSKLALARARLRARVAAKQADVQMQELEK